MKKKGFTLIELLAVIVILAIIALIATPIVMNVIENSRKGAAERSVENYMAAVEVVVGTERIDGKILDGEYTIQPDGNLCPTTGCGDNNEYKVNVDMSGDKPTSGTIFIDNGLVTTDSTMKVGDYIVSYDSSKESYVATKPEVTKICRPATEEGDDAVTTGNVPTGAYEYKDEYKCELGDGEVRTFFVLENGDKTGLNKIEPGTFNKDTETVGITDANEVTLIMDRNYDNETSRWCISGDQNTCNADGLQEKLNQIRKEWTDLAPEQINLPTYAQIEKARVSDKQWLGYKLDNDTNTDLPFGYWTSSAHSTIYARIVNYGGGTQYDPVYWDHNAGVRPVITISKDQIR